ncbi:MAG: serpin family protein [Anaerolineae bacterium]|nr:serpin family protein [Anaerolineae bacterium]
MIRKSQIILVSVLWVALLFAACSSTAPNIPGTDESPAISAPEGDTEPVDVRPGETKLVRADVERDTAPQIDSTDRSALASGNAAFAFDLYQQLRTQDGNLIYSPYSISVALAMTYAGADGSTARQMADTLHFTLPQDKLHPAFNALGLALDSRNMTIEDPESGEEKTAVQLEIANALWAQAGFPFKQPFMEMLGRNYDAGVRQVDFVNAPEPARQAINQWASEKTHDKIQDIIPEGVISPDTRLVLANAIYLNALWQSQFEESATQDEPFYLLDGSQTQVSMMHQQETFGYVSGDGYQAVDLPYMGGQLSMLAIVPDQDKFADVESIFDAAYFEQVREALESQLVNLGMPRFEFETSIGLSDILIAMGMPEAFDGNRADFSGMAEEDLYISAVLHKAYIKANESGTEAAAATAVVMDLAMAPLGEPINLTIDRPFLFVLYDHETGAILFVGRVLSPAG